MQRWALLAVPAFLLLACSDMRLNTGSQARTDAGPPPNPVDAASADAPTGVGCGTDPNTGATLCLGISSCPNLSIDPGAYPDCGFRVLPGVIDIECSCSGELCPLGTATSCTEAARLLREQNEGVVCQQIVEGRCTGGSPSGTQDAGAGTCDPSCRDSCAGSPPCIQL